MKPQPATPRHPRQPVLIVIHGDGFLEAFAEPGVDVHFAPMPFSESRQGELMADEVFEHSLPHRYRQLYWPGKLRGHAVVRRLLPSELANRDIELQLLRDFDALKATTDKQTADHQRREVRVWTL